MEITGRNTSKIWLEIEKDYDERKKTFSRKIKFVTDAFKKKVIFRDIEHAYYLSNNGFCKPAIILAGGVIEELLRLYLSYKNVRIISNTIDSYIKACETNGLLKPAIHRIPDSVKNYHNIVHLSKETTSRYAFSKAAAKGAVASIFAIVNNFHS